MAAAVAAVQLRTALCLLCLQQLEHVQHLLRNRKAPELEQLADQDM